MVVARGAGRARESERTGPCSDEPRRTRPRTRRSPPTRSPRGSTGPPSPPAASGGSRTSSGPCPGWSTPSPATRADSWTTQPTSRSAPEPPVTPRRCWSPSIRAASPSTGCWRSSGATTTRPPSNRQGPDRGTQYRSAVFVHDEVQAKTARASLDEYQARFRRPIVTEVVPATTFWPAEAYHQRFAERTGRGGCHVANW